MRRSRLLSSFSLAAPFAACFSTLLTASALAGTITGTVSDRTSNKVAAHDTVVLIGFGQEMQEVARTTTDEHGRYTLQTPDNGTHLVRVDHQKAAYFQPAPPAAHTVDVDVYDVAEKVKGIHTEADVLTMQTDPDGLHVIENYFVKNDSQPAMTQLSRRAYEIYLPASAKIEATAAMGPGGMPVASSPLRVGDAQTDPGHYAFIFPVRPGETRFQISYHLPYSGSLAFSQKVALPTENLVVILPKSMQFAPRGTEFQPVPDSVASQTFVRKGISPAQPVLFNVAGTGIMPREGPGNGSGNGAASGQGGDAGQAASAGGQGSPTAAQPDGSSGSSGATGAALGPDTRPGGGLGPPIDTPDPLNKYKWWILSGLALALVVAAALLLRKPREPAAEAGLVGAAGPLPPAAPGAAVTTTYGASPPAASLTGTAAPVTDGSAPSGSVRAENATTAGYADRPGSSRSPAASPGFLSSLKDALFALETERLSGQTSEEDYRRLKASLEVVLRQALEQETARR